MRITPSCSRQPKAMSQLFCLTVSVWTTATVLNFNRVHSDVPRSLTHPIHSERMRNNRHTINGTSEIGNHLRSPRLRRQIKSAQNNHVALDSTDLHARNYHDIRVSGSQSHRYFATAHAIMISYCSNFYETMSG